MNRSTAEDSTILRGLVGSTVHGLSVNDGIEDRDETRLALKGNLTLLLLLFTPDDQLALRPARIGIGMPHARGHP